MKWRQKIRRPPLRKRDTRLPVVSELFGMRSQHYILPCPSEIILNERLRNHDLNLVLLGLYNLHRLGSLGYTLAANLLSPGSCLAHLLIVFLAALEEFLLAARLAHMAHVDMHTLAQLAISNHLGELNTHCILIHVENDASLAMVERMWHTLLDGGVDLHINHVSAFEGCQPSGCVWLSLGPISLGELVSCTMPETSGDRMQLAHGCAPPTIWIPAGCGLPRTA